VPELLDIGHGVSVAHSVLGSGPPLLLLHGAEGSHRMFDAIAPHLAVHFTVVAYDQRDCGETRNPATASTLADLADDAQALLLALGHTKAHVYGTSFGGRVAQALAHRHPRLIDRLVLGSTWPLPLSLAALNPTELARIDALRARLPESAEELAEFFLPPAFLASRPDLRGIFRNSRPQTERSKRRAATVADHPPLEPSAITASTLVMAGEVDRVVPAAVTVQMAQEMPHAASTVLPGVGHAGAIQVPEAIAGLIRSFCLAPSAAATGALA
jgi:pimeloyl-ACP methyl ester carboxylesterase